MRISIPTDLQIGDRLIVVADTVGVRITYDPCWFGGKTPKHKTKGGEKRMKGPKKGGKKGGCHK